MAFCFTDCFCVSLAPPTVTRGSIRVENGLISEIGADVTPATDDEVISLEGGVIMTGLVVGHHHLYSALARGMPAPPCAPQNFTQILEKIWWVLDRCLDKESVELSALVGLLSAVRCGATTVVDHHASPSCTTGSLNMLGDAFRKIGVRGVLCYETSDRAGREEAERGIAENKRFAEANQESKLLRGTVGAHASFTLSDASLKEISEVCAQLHLGIHIHLLEGSADREVSIKEYGSDPIKRLIDFGLLNEKSLLVHGVHMQPEEIDMVAKSGATLIHNGRSNMNNRVGRSPLGLMEKAGVKIALGTDGIDGDILTEARCAFFRGSEESSPPSFGLSLDMLAQSQAIVAESFNQPIGKMEVGAPADFTILDYNPQTPMHENNLAGHLIFGGLGPENVRSVMVNGDFILRDRKFVHIDTQTVYKQSRSAAERLWADIEKTWNK